MTLKDRVTDEVLDRGDHARVQSADMRCLCETIAICFDELIAELRALRQESRADEDLRFNTELYKEDK